MAVWTASWFPSLPLDVLHLVGVLAQPSDLCSMLQVSRALNKALTPILYFNIELDAWDPILKCITTLNSKSAYVRSLVIKRPAARSPSYVQLGAKAAIADALLNVLPLMVNLKHFSSSIGLGPRSSDIFCLLATGSCASLQTIELQVLDDVPTALESTEPDEIESLALQVPPNLRRLALELPMGSSAHWQRSFVRHLLRTCAPTLRTLSITIDDYVTGIWDHFLPPDADFVHLENLGIEYEALSHPSLLRAVNVCSLKLSGARVPSGPINPLSAEILPSLRSLSCPAELVAAFLHPDTDRCRPIATVCIGNASYRSSAERDHSWNRPDPSGWRNVFTSLQHLRYSAVPVTSLTVDVVSIPLAGVHAAHWQPYLATLESLDIVYHRGYTKDPLSCQLASELVAHLPRLHTLLISRAPPERKCFVPLDEEESMVAEALQLSRKMVYEFKSRSALRRFALSTAIEWHKDDDGWRWVGDRARYGELGGHLDDPDYQDGSSEYDGEAEDERDGVDEGYEDEREDVDPGNGDEREDVDSESELEAPEDTRFLPVDV
ncbi:hypothetical protein LXA43DRAFT_683422 [Ganoderma leucocontextum]|nr:hypothetical protein LXA43DRAFT_683422 [Ganoderma leucocontextum]